MGSIAGINPYPNGGSYSISKYALHGYTLNLREETRELGIRVTALNPGATYTASWEGSGIEEERLMPASDIANSVFSRDLARIRPPLGPKSCLYVEVVVMSA